MVINSSLADSVILLKNAHLVFPLQTGTRASLRSILARPFKDGRVLTDRKQSPSLADISLDLKNGDRLGLLGSNGAGKSTLLRMLAGIYMPTMGSCYLAHQPACLFDLNVGFDFEASGYQNIPIAAAQLGYSISELADVRAHVEEFSELGNALHLPVRALSSGMQMRLAFSIAVYRQSSILLIDEIVGVGDSYFIEKAIKYVKHRISSQGVLVLASHAENIIRDFCNTGLVLDKGGAIYMGPVEEAIDFYRGYRAKFST